MKNLTKIFTLSLGLLLLATLSYAQNVIVDSNKSYSNIKSIEVNGGWLDVTYEGGSGSEVKVEAYLESNETNQDIVFVTLGDVLKISHERNNNNYSWNSKNKGYIKITGPKEVALQLRNSSGSIVVNNVSNDETQLKVSSGKISASAIDGNLDIQATSGSLKIEGIKGDVIAGVTSGNADIFNVTGDVKYKSTSGSLDAENIAGEINISLTSGNARLNTIGSLGSLRFTSGNIRAENAGLGDHTSFEGTSGNFKVQTSSDLKAFNFSLKASSGNVKVGNISTGKSLEMDNGSSSWVKGSISSGNITIEN
ncbi:MAG: lia operon protein LiaG [Algoriphagus sp.]|jgi:lia operon protein LiaG